MQVATSKLNKQLEDLYTIVESICSHLQVNLPMHLSDKECSMTTVEERIALAEARRSPTTLLPNHTLTAGPRACRALFTP